MSADHVPYSLAPRRVFLDGRQVDVSPSDWTPPEHSMSRMRYDGVELPENTAPEPKPLSPGEAQLQDEEARFWKWLDHQQTLSRADLAGQQEAQKAANTMLARRRYRNATGRSHISPVEDGSYQRGGYRG